MFRAKQDILNSKYLILELALLNDQPRAATVSAKSPMKIAALSRDAFVRLLGPVVDILKRNTERYNDLNLSQ
jgi:cAMP-dependent protein kinase regulator